MKIYNYRAILYLSQSLHNHGNIKIGVIYKATTWLSWLFWVFFLIQQKTGKNKWCPLCLHPLPSFHDVSAHKTANTYCLPVSFSNTKVNSVITAFNFRHLCSERTHLGYYTVRVRLCEVFLFCIFFYRLIKRLNFVMWAVHYRWRAFLPVVQSNPHLRL